MPASWLRPRSAPGASACIWGRPSPPAARAAPVSRTNCVAPVSIVRAPAAADALADSAFDFCSRVAALADNEGLVFREPAVVATSGWLMFCWVEGVMAEARERARCAGAEGARAGPSSAFCWAASRRAAEEGVGAGLDPRRRGVGQVVGRSRAGLTLSSATQGKRGRRQIGSSRGARLSGGEQLRCCISRRCAAHVGRQCGSSGARRALLAWQRRRRGGSSGSHRR